MKRERKKIWIAAALLLPAGLIALAALVQGPAAGEMTGAVSTGLSILVPAADFNDDGLAAQTYAYDDVGGYTYPSSDTQLCMQAPVYLPHGVTVTEFGGYVLDNNNQAEISRIELRRVQYLDDTPLGTNSDLMAESNTANDVPLDAVQWISDNNIENGPVVDTATYAYYAVVCMDGSGDESLRLYAVEALYTQ